MNIPNSITLSRLIFIVGFAVSYLLGYNTISGVMLIIIGLSDVLDGYFARILKQESNLGAALDPLIDKTLVITIMVCFLIKQTISPLIVIIYILKDVGMIVSGYIITKKDNYNIKANWMGKLSAVIFFLCVFFTVILDLGKYYVNMIFLVSIAVSLIASLNYVVLFFQFKKNKEVN